MRLIVGETPAVLQQYRLLKDLDREGAHRFFDLIKRLSGASARVNRHHSAPVKHGVWVRGKTHSSGLLQAQAQFQKAVDALCKGHLVVE